jgi:hypothetical protein
MPAKEQCTFYHCLDFPDGESVLGQWDIRGRFDQYVGHYPLRGKTVLDMGSASGFLCFSAEAAGANVTALDCADASDLERIPFSVNLYHTDRGAWDRQANNAGISSIRNGFWYAWHKFGSKATVSYTPIRRLPYFDETFDVVIAGAIIEHLADPVGAIGAMCRLADEAVIVAFTPVANDAKATMVPMGSWADPQVDYTWWLLSKGLLDRVFANLGFQIELYPARAQARIGEVGDQERFTVVARRIAARGERPLVAAAADCAGENPPPAKLLKRIRRFFA